jgi:hypothetical protein
VPDREKTKAALSDFNKDHNHRFSDIVQYLEATGWTLRQKGSHYIFSRPGFPALLNLQPENDGRAKAYQIRQVRRALSTLNT